MTKRPTESRGGVKGGTSSLFVCPLAGSRGGAPLWGLGQRPNCSSFNLLQGKSQQGAGSEASLPVTLRSRRSAPKLLFPPCCTLSRQRGATEHPKSLINGSCAPLRTCRFYVLVLSSCVLPHLPGAAPFLPILPPHPSHQLPFNPARWLLIRYERQKVNRIRKILDFRRLPSRCKLLEI